MKGHELAMGDFLTILPNDTILNYSCPRVPKIPSWEDRMVLFLTLCLNSKTWKKFVDGS